MLSEALRYEYAQNNVRVMASCPGATDSNFRNTASEKSSDRLKQRISKLKGEGQVGDKCKRVSKETLDTCPMVVFQAYTMKQRLVIKT